MTAPNYPQFMFAYGSISAVFAKIQSHDVPEIFTHDFLRFTLGFSRESDRAFIPLAKRTGLLTTDGVPTELYRRLRDPAQAAAVVAEGMKLGFVMFYAKDPDVQKLDRKALAALVADVTGMELGHPSARAIMGTYLALKTLAGPRLETERVVNRRKVVERRSR